MSKAVEGYISGNEDEDTLTGDLGASLRTNSQKVDVPPGNEISGIWTWSITYYKFRGRGNKATENAIGADGIFELKLNWGNNESQKKCILFQAKNRWQRADKSLLEQTIKLSTWREASFILNYAPNNYEAFFIDDGIKAKGSRSGISESIPLGAFLSRYFLECLIGDIDLNYDAQSRKLSWRALENKMVSTKFSIPHRFTININPPKKRRRAYINPGEINNDEILNYRMQASEEDILSLSPNYNEKDVNSALKRLVKVYHTDLHENLDEFYKEILKRRMQEINYARNKLSSEPQRKR